MSRWTSAVLKTSRRGLLIAVASSAALVGCSPRDVPASFPRSSAASPDAEEPAAPRVGIAVAQDPPLPGEPTDGWYGLGQKPADGAHDHHHHHHHHGAAQAQAPADAAARPAPGQAPASEGSHAH